MPDYLPAPDSDFNTWQSNFIGVLAAQAGAFKIAPETISDLVNLQLTWQTAFNAAIGAQAIAAGAVKDKQNARGDFRDAIRAIVAQLQADPAMTDQIRGAMGITVPDDQLTPVAPPATRPLVSVDTAQRLQHRLSLADEQTPTRRARPAGAIGAEVWVKIGGDPPTGATELKFAGLATRSPFTLEHDGNVAGQTAHYMVRWINGKGAAGPWSETASATIPA